MGDAPIVNTPELWRSLLPLPAATGHKYQRGHALIVGGYPMTGAARLAAHATARIGAGLTTIAVPEVAFPIYAAALTSIMVYPFKSAKSLANLISERSFAGFLIGCGAGVGAATRENVSTILAARRPTVLDADALTSFAEQPDMLFKAMGRDCVLTPHEGEFGRLFTEVGERPERACAAARRSGAVVVLKGQHTVIASPDGRWTVNTNAPPTLATAGSGDVLGGIILGLLTQGMPSFEAAAAGVWVHGAAAASFGPGLIADDLHGLLPRVLRELQL